MGKLGQVETMGLVIIVVLIVLLGVFFLAFNLRGEVSPEDRVFLGVKAGNLANSLKSVGVGSLFVDWCNGDSSKEDEIEEMILPGFEMIDEDVSLVFECFDGRSLVFGDCPTGIVSEDISLSSGHSFFARICAK